jgi:glycosyltransferase involved in cell wall biosynthesis
LLQVTKFKRIVIASVLKPIDDTRMAEKMGLSFSASGILDVHILGFPTTGSVNDVFELHHHSLTKKPFGRFSWARIIAPLIVLRKVLVLRPEFFIITTHELLIVAMLSKLLIGCTVIYDVQENYFRNIVYTKTFPILIRHLLGAWVRIKEVLCSRAITLFILAEKCYAQELTFARPFLIAENKVSKKQAESFSKKFFTGYCNILFTGTLAETTGVFKTIELCRQLNILDPSITLTIIGSCSSQDSYDRLTALSNTYTFIKFRGLRHPVPHKEILSEINKADFGIIYYPYNPSTADSVPTKLYEYLALRLPILIHHSEETTRLVITTGAGIRIPEDADYEVLLEQMKSFTPNPQKPNHYWEDDFAPILNRIIQP